MIAYSNGIQLYISALYVISHHLSLKVGIRMGRALHKAFYLCYYNRSFITDTLPTELRILRNGSTINIDPYPQDSSLYYQLSPSSDNDTSTWIMLNEESISIVWFKETYEITFSNCPGVTENRTFIIGL